MAGLPASVFYSKKKKKYQTIIANGAPDSGCSSSSEEDELPRCTRRYLQSLKNVVIPESDDSEVVPKVNTGVPQLGCARALNFSNDSDSECDGRSIDLSNLSSPCVSPISSWLNDSSEEREQSESVAGADTNASASAQNNKRTDTKVAYKQAQPRVLRERNRAVLMSQSRISPPEPRLHPSREKNNEKPMRPQRYDRASAKNLTQRKATSNLKNNCASSSRSRDKENVSEGMLCDSPNIENSNNYNGLSNDSDSAQMRTAVAAYASGSKTKKSKSCEQVNPKNKAKKKAAANLRKDGASVSQTKHTENVSESMLCNLPNSEDLNDDNGIPSDPASGDSPVWVHRDLEEASRSPTVVPSTFHEVKKPVEYFQMYFDCALLKLLVTQTYLHSEQSSREKLNLTEKELENWLGIWICMGICTLPSCLYYWNQNTRISQAADVMPLKRFEKIRTHLHAVDNASLDYDDPERDRFAKVRPVLDHIRAKCNNLKQENHFSIDEAMIPYKGRFAGNLKQYIKSKPHKWGFKFFVLAGVSGIVYDFLPYCGSNTFRNENLSEEESNMGVGAKVLVSLCKRIEKPETSVVYYDNFFTSIGVMTYLKDRMKILSLGTVRRNRMDHCPLSSEKDLRKKGRGSSEVLVNKDNVAVIQWMDNKVVTVASTVAGINPPTKVDRFDKTARQPIQVPCPRVIQLYNGHMGGVDKSDMLIELYRVPGRAKRWYFGLIGYMVDLALVNSWLLYRRECEALGENPSIKSSKEFRLLVSRSLCLANSTRKRGRPSLDDQPMVKKPIRRPVAVRPENEERFDDEDHWPAVTDVQNRCKNCPNGYTKMKCLKCNMNLCLTKKKNCFVQFHRHV